jgi:hypothetical protein
VDSIPALTENDQWRKILNRLTIYAQRKFVRLGWKNKDGYRSPRGQGPEDIASEVILRTIESRRVYNAERCPDFEQFLRGGVDSIISHIIDSPEFEKRKSMPFVVTDKGETEEIEFEGREADPLQICIEKDMVQKVKTILEKNFAEDKIVIGIFECYKAGIYKRSELAGYLEVDIKEIDNAQKRLRREMDKYLQK